MGKWLESAQKVRAAMDVAGEALNDETALQAVALYTPWVSGVWYAFNERIRYHDLLYRCVQAHTSQADWTPDVTTALWVRVSVEEWPEWVQPTGAHDAYNTGDKVTYNGSRYVCTMDANVYAPDVSGWEKQ